MGKGKVSSSAVKHDKNKAASNAIKKLEAYIIKHPKDVSNASKRLEYVKKTGKTKK